MESLSFESMTMIKESLLNIRKSISLLMEWNRDLQNVEEWLNSSTGMQKLAANCMLIEAIGEAVKKIEHRAGEEFLSQRPEIPWSEVMSMRNHIAHGYFEIDEDYVFSVIKNDLLPLMEAIDALIKHVETMMIEKEVDDHCTDPVPSRGT